MIKKAIQKKEYKPRGRGSMIFSCSIDSESGQHIKDAEASPSFIFQLGYKSWKNGIISDDRGLIAEALYQRFLAYMNPARDEIMVLKWLESDFFSEERARLGASGGELRVIIREKFKADKQLCNNKYFQSVLGMLRPKSPALMPTHPGHAAHARSMEKKFIESEARDAVERAQAEKERKEASADADSG